MRYYVRQLNKNLLNVLRSKKADGLKISQIIIYVNSHFDVFLYHERHCTRTFWCFSLPWKTLHQNILMFFTTMKDIAQEHFDVFLYQFLYLE